jgi:hypothetical protein
VLGRPGRLVLRDHLERHLGDAICARTRCAAEQSCVSSEPSEPPSIEALPCSRTSSGVCADGRVDRSASGSAVALALDCAAPPRPAAAADVLDEGGSECGCAVTGGARASAHEAERRHLGRSVGEISSFLRFLPHTCAGNGGCPCNAGSPLHRRRAAGHHLQRGCREVVYRRYRRVGHRCLGGCWLRALPTSDETENVARCNQVAFRCHVLDGKRRNLGARLRRVAGRVDEHGVRRVAHGVVDAAVLPALASERASVRARPVPLAQHARGGGTPRTPLFGANLRPGLPAPTSTPGQTRPATGPWHRAGQPGAAARPGVASATPPTRNLGEFAAAGWLAAGRASPNARRSARR